MKTILPITKKHSSKIQMTRMGIRCAAATTRGLVKPVNEDCIGILSTKNFTRMCIADGHWGNFTAKLIVNQWLKVNIFPNSRTKAITATKFLENILFSKFGSTSVNENTDFTPEASFIAVEQNNNNFTILGFGDCRLLVIRNKRIVFSLETSSTWLGVFSKLGLRKRLSIQKALKFQRLILQGNEHILLFTDGVDQCKYEIDSISMQIIANTCKLIVPHKIIMTLFKKIFNKGAEDNASLVVLTMPRVVNKNML